MVQILVPMDFSKESYLALEWAAKLSYQLKKSTIFLLHVSPRTADAAQQAGAKELMQQLRALMPTDLEICTGFRQGHIPEEIARLSQQEKVDMVVMTTRGRFGAARELEGSITEETVRLAPCPVLVLHLNQVTAEAVKQRFEGFLPHPDDGNPF